MENNLEKRTITISKASPEDATQTHEVFYRSWLDTYPNEEAGITVEDVEERFKDRTEPEKIDKRAEQISSLPENEAYFVAKDGEKVVGLCRAIIHPEKNQIQAIYILPEYKRQGIGSALWEAARGFMDPKKETYVELAQYNDTARAFYEKLGFKDTEERFSNERFRMKKSGVVIPEMRMLREAEEK